MNASIALQILPHADTNAETVRIVDEVIDYIKSTGLHYAVGAFETSVEGDFDTLMEIIKKAQLIAINAGSTKVSSYVKIAYAPEGNLLTIDEKIKKHQQ
ncbi:thiamine-binding protein [Erysipelothrix sp. HDW6C]|uniref:thiamine-binding protein n=1 Tax=Erysipelothrix sp. HDW6C TaxID=2714930 RepID=UPI00140799DC|nr:thiamine-binding protein [Erysipelothrix sp. HDW6C]QIK69510.1 thiamine-binding protein [Erysipelothrix sp. HDW6C]